MNDPVVTEGKLAASDLHLVGPRLLLVGSRYLSFNQLVRDDWVDKRVRVTAELIDPFYENAEGDGTEQRWEVWYSSTETAVQPQVGSNLPPPEGSVCIGSFLCSYMADAVRIGELMLRIYQERKGE